MSLTPLHLSVGLKNLSAQALNEHYEELECTIKDYSETLISELALRDELEYEKELKNQFISLLLNIQKKRRESQGDKKKNHKKQKSANGTEPGTVSENKVCRELSSSFQMDGWIDVVVAEACIPVAVGDFPPADGAC